VPAFSEWLPTVVAGAKEGQLRLVRQPPAYQGGERFPSTELAVEVAQGAPTRSAEAEWPGAPRFPPAAASGRSRLSVPGAGAAEARNSTASGGIRERLFQLRVALSVGGVLVLHHRWDDHGALRASWRGRGCQEMLANWWGSWPFDPGESAARGRGRGSGHGAD